MLQVQSFSDHSQSLQGVRFEPVATAKSFSPARRPRDYFIRTSNATPHILLGTISIQ